MLDEDKGEETHGVEHVLHNDHIKGVKKEENAAQRKDDFDLRRRSWSVTEDSSSSPLEDMSEQEKGQGK